MWTIYAANKNRSLCLSRVKSSEQGTSLFLIQPGVEAPPPPDISLNMGCFLCYSAFGNIRGQSPYIPTSRSRLNPTGMATREPVQRPWIAFTKKGPSILRQLGNYRDKPTAGRQVFNTELHSGTMFSIQPSVSTTNPPPSLWSGLVQSPLSGYIGDGDESSVWKESLLHWRQ